MTDGTPEANDIEAAVRLLRGNPDFRVLRRLDLDRNDPVELKGVIDRAAVVDIETTGVTESDRLIEFAIVVFEYSPDTGDIGSIVGHYQGLEDPGRQIPPEARAVHGITDAMVGGLKLEEASITQLLRGIALIIAHNAQFDRPVVERRMPVFAKLPWACSYVQVPWAEEGMRSGRLENLAAHFGFFYDSHRSEADCRALLELLKQPLPKSGTTAFSILLKNALEPSYRMWASGSSFDSNQKLRGRGYRWDAHRKCWGKLVGPGGLQDEGQWLRTHIYGGGMCQVDVEEIGAMTNFSSRRGLKTKRVF